MRIRSLTFALACVLALLATLPAASGAQPDPRLGSRVLTEGMKGTDVFHLNVLLQKRGFSAAKSRRFSHRTLLAVKSAQRAYGLSVDGVVGRATLSALRGGAPHTSRPSQPAGGARACPSTPGSGDSVTRWRPVILCVLGMLHASRTEAHVQDAMILIRYESGGNPNARNDWDVNAKGGDPSRGLVQTIGATFAAYRSRSLPNDIFDPAANLYAGLHYGIARYGSIEQIPGVKAVNAGKRYVPYRQVAP